MTYSQALDYMYACLPMFHRIGPAAYKNNLDNTIALCNVLGNPQNKFKSVHIAGTNGKGSVSHMTASVLQEAGFKTGLCTSPHLKDFRERIRINGKKIPRGFVSHFIAQYKKDFETIQPSFFEMTIGLTFMYFAHEGVDIAVIETGLGGRLDSTNVITPELCVITNISTDHTALLGYSLAQIASEKAGIIKPGVPVIIGEKQETSETVFRNKAKSVKAPLSFAEEIVDIRSFQTSAQHAGQAVVEAELPRTKEEINFISPLAGFYQKNNIVTALAACHALNKLGWHISKENLQKGLQKTIINTGLLGRWQILDRKPLTICDTGHNEAGIKALMEQIETLKFKKLHIVLGMVNDKDIDAVLPLFPRKARFYFCKPDIPRGLDAQVLCEKGAACGLKGLAYASVNDALGSARANAAPGDLIFVGGSTFVVAEVV